MLPPWENRIRAKASHSNPGDGLASGWESDPRQVARSPIRRDGNSQFRVFARAGCSLARLRTTATISAAATGLATCV